MVVSSILFIFGFLPVFLVLYFSLPGRERTEQLRLSHHSNATQAVRPLHPRQPGYHAWDRWLNFGLLTL